MLAFGLTKKLCNDFLKKQAVIGNLDEGESRPEAGLPSQGPVLCRPGSPPAEGMAPVLARSGVLSPLGRPSSVSVDLNAQDTACAVWKLFQPGRVARGGGACSARSGTKLRM